MKSAGPLKHFVLAFVIALIVYAISYTWIENRRTRQGPWEVGFQQANGGAPTVTVTQPQLGISNVSLTFPGEQWPATNVLVRFSEPLPVPFEVPFGQCLFIDTTFQPGTLAFNFFGHEIQFIPRVLTIDKKERSWRSDLTLSITNRGVLEKPAK